MIYKRKKVYVFVVIIVLLGLVTLSCGQKKEQAAPAPAPEAEPSLPQITGMAALDSILKSAGSQMVVLDLYADWCMPCRILEPVFKDLAKQYAGKAQFYRIDVDHNREAAEAFGVRGIPYVVFMRNSQPVYALTGVNPRGTYEKVVTACANAVSPEECAKSME
ncbi:MAG: thioredoxin domain-containing protein [Chitinispirillaceae bacterium]|nr:thioredoxin domain-containing protein [Chitinispirillaceae bacterium]